MLNVISASGYNKVLSNIGGEADSDVQLSVVGSLQWTNLVRLQSFTAINLDRSMSALTKNDRPWGSNKTMSTVSLTEGGSFGPLFTTLGELTSDVASPNNAIRWLDSANGTLATLLLADANEQLFQLPPTEIDGDLPVVRYSWFRYRQPERVDILHYANFVSQSQKLRSAVHRYFMSEDITVRVLEAESKLEQHAQRSPLVSIDGVQVRRALEILDDLLPAAQGLFAAARFQFPDAWSAYVPFMRQYLVDSKYVTKADVEVNHNLIIHVYYLSTYSVDHIISCSRVS
jgi:hypothetical protein